MSDEQRMILQMVADGKITPDEGAKLLEAISNKTVGKSEKQPFEDWSNLFGSFFSEDPFNAESNRSPKSISVPYETALTVKSYVGSLILIGIDETDLKVSGAPRGQYQLRQSDRGLSIKTTLPIGTLKIHIPRNIVGLTVTTHVGQILVQNLSNSLYDCEIRSHTGSITVDTQTLVDGRFNIRSHIGKIDFLIPRESNAEIIARCKLGGIHTDLPLDITDDSLGNLRGTLNNSGAEIRIQSNLGQIFIGEKGRIS